MYPRTSTIERDTTETSVSATVDLDGTGAAQVSTQIGFLDHLLTNFARHSGCDLALTCKGDLEVDDHHSAEDSALALGEAIDKALGDRRGIVRFGSAYAPLDESLSRAVVDLVGRPWAEISLGLKRDAIGGIAAENIEHLLRSLALAGRFTIHIDTLRGENDHHRAESAIKALALAFRQAVARDGTDACRSTKEKMR